MEKTNQPETKDGRESELVVTALRCDAPLVSDESPRKEPLVTRTLVANRPRLPYIAKAVVAAVLPILYVPSLSPPPLPIIRRRPCLAAQTARRPNRVRSSTPFEEGRLLQTCAECNHISAVLTNDRPKQKKRRSVTGLQLQTRLAELAIHNSRRPLTGDDRRRRRASLGRVHKTKLATLHAP